MPGSRLVSLAAGTILDVTPPDAVDVAAASGFPAVGVWFDPQSWSEAVARNVRRRLDQTGVVALDIEPIMLTPEGDHADAIVEAAKIVGAQNILVASRDGDHSRVAARLHALGELLDGAPIRIVLEFLPVLAVKTMPAAQAIVEAADHRALGILVDSLHLARAGHRPDELRTVEPRLLPYLQLCDAPATAPADSAGLLHEALHGRLLPGDGNLPLTELLDAVPAVPVSFELRSATLREGYPDPVDRARALLAAARHNLALS